MRFILMVLLVALVACGPQSAMKTSAGDDFAVIAVGEAVDLSAYVAASGFTVFDFYADWCPPCKQLDKSLLGLTRIYGDLLQVYKLDLVEWESNLAKHHGIRDLPYLMVYRDGEFVREGPSNEVLPLLIGELNSLGAGR